MSFKPDTIERRLSRLEKKLREQRDELFNKSRGVNATLSGGVGVGTGGRGGTGSFGALRSFIPQDITIDDLDENRNPTGNFEHITLGAGVFLRIKADTGIAGQLKFIHGTIQDGQFLILSPDSTQPGATLRLLTGGNISIANDVVLQRNEIAILLFDETLPLNDPNGNYMVIAGGVGGAGVVCPVICEENDLGDVSGVTPIDWSISPFHRMRLIGDTQIVMQGLPTSPGWQEITLEFLEDGTGGHTVTFLDIFRNTPVPVVRKGANRYTIVKFYSYFDVIDNILTWQPPFFTNSEMAQPSINQGMIHVTLTADQVTNLAVNDHIEFDDVKFLNNLQVFTIGVGQANGIFSGFKTFRTYELTASLGTDRGNPRGGSISYQWFDIATNILIGTQGTAQDPGEDNPYQTIAKAFFQPFNENDTVELRIISQSGNPIDVIYSGIPSVAINQTPQTFAEIKDCGQTPTQFEAGLEELIDEPAIVPPEPPLIGFRGRMMYYNFFREDSYGRAGQLAVNGEINIPFMGRRELISNNVSLSADTAVSRETMCVNVGVLKKLIIKWDFNGINRTYDVDLMRDDVKVTTLLTIPALTSGTFEWPSVGSLGNIPLEFGHTYYYKFKTIDGLNPGGLMSGSIVTKIFWGGA